MAYYREDLAHAHHLGFGFHAELCAPGILNLLEPVLATKGVVLDWAAGVVYSPATWSRPGTG